MKKEFIFKFNDERLCYGRFYDKLYDCVFSREMRYLFSQQHLEEIFSFLLGQIKEYGKLYCFGNKFQVCRVRIEK